MANTLAGLIAVNKPDATATGVTNASGHLTFTELSDGLYLAVSDSVDVKVANASGKNRHGRALPAACSSQCPKTASPAGRVC